ncbi:hypothetical protein ACFVYA_39745 [Amycolatopsis sp. NPDC058278]|uniref:hypothetical protein n=1 Tax=Amycolatopsis sp. NPDC058278 TaxID=3346417 RepID=UPI0036D924E0
MPAFVPPRQEVVGHPDRVEADLFGPHGEFDQVPDDATRVYYLPEPLFPHFSSDAERARDDLQRYPELWLRRMVADTDVVPLHISDAWSGDEEHFVLWSDGMLAGGSPRVVDTELAGSSFLRRSHDRHRRAPDRQLTCSANPGGRSAGATAITVSSFSPKSGAIGVSASHLFT